MPDTPSEPTSSQPDGPVLFYDGQCGLCDRSVRWCLDRDRRGVLRFAPLQGETYARLPNDDKPDDLSTVALLDGGRLFMRSDAVVRLLGHLGGTWTLLGAMGRVIPRGARDGLYRFIAKRRLRWFGGAEACKLPSRGERERMLP